MKNFLIVNNPVSGKGKTQGKVRELEGFLRSREIPYTILDTTAERRADSVIQQEFGPEYSHVIVAGGDGSMYDAINGLPNYDRPVGILPIGSGNDVAKNFDLGKGFEYLAGDQTAEMDIGRFNDKLFLNGIGAGFDGQIIVNMLNGKGIFSGHSAYYYHVVKILGSYRERILTYHIDGKTYKEPVLLIIAAIGTTFGGGFKLAPEADSNDGLLDICVVHRIHPIMRFLKLNRLKSGNHLDMKEVSYYKAKELKIEEADIHGQVDGEYAGKPPYRIDLLPDKLKVMIASKT